AYRHPDPAAGRELMVKLIESLSAGVPRPLVEIAKLGRTLASEPLTYWPTSTGPAPATAQPKRSTAAWRTCAAPPSASEPHQLHRPMPTRDRRIQTRLHRALVKSRSSWGSAKIRRKPATSDLELNLPQVRCCGGWVSAAPTRDSDAQTQPEARSCVTVHSGLVRVPAQIGQRRTR